MVPVLITWDIDPAPQDAIDESIILTTKLLRELNIKSTFFFTANYANEDIISILLKEGHQIGCHGLYHDDNEELNKLSYAEQRTLLEKATKILEEKSKRKITAFRGPRVKISAQTIKVLEELGYKADSTIGSQRLDLISSNLINLGWLTAPRKPYHPARNNPYKKGSSGILEIPVSAAIIPFISTSLRIFGLGFMKSLFNILYKESKRTGKPLVYLIHPIEFLSKKTKFDIKYLIPNRRWLIHGLPIRHYLAGRKDGKETYELNKRLFQYISSKKDIRFMNVDEYIRQVSS
jgi:peptidoglycan/xylan/chitin deacetylase (PgdA/CDA1 family)